MDKKIRAWSIVFAGTLITGTAYAAVVNCFSIFIIPVCEANGFARGWFNIALTLMYFSYMIGSIFSGRLYQRVSVKTLMVISGVLMPVLYFLLAYARSLAAFYVLFMLIGLIMPYISFAAFTVLIHDWFDEGEGTAVGIAFMGSGIGGMILNVLVARWIGSFGYAFAFRILSLIIAAIVLPISIFLVKPNHPNYGVVRTQDKGSALLIPGTARLMVIATLIGFGITILSQTMPPHLADLGFSPMYAATMNACFMLGLCLAKLLMGFMFDKLGIRKTMLISILVGVAGAMSYFFGMYRVLHPVMVIGAGMAVALGSVAYPVLAKHMCKAEIFASAAGNASAFSFLGSAVAPFFMNAMFDRIGTYRPGYVISAVTFLIVLYLVLGHRAED